MIAAVFAAVGFAAVGFAAGVLLWRLTEFWSADDFDDHVERALAQTRHPSTSPRPVCACDQPDRRAAHGPTRCVPVVGCACRGLAATVEPMVHGDDVCQPRREVLS